MNRHHYEKPSARYGSRTERLAVRRAVFARDGGVCAHCGRETARDTPGAFGHRWEVDHRLPICDGGINDLNNLQTLCLRHHKAKTASEAARRAKERRFNVQPATCNRREANRAQPAQQTKKLGIGDFTTMKIPQPGKDFELCPTGQHQAVICDVIDGGWEARTFQGEYKGVGPRMKLVFQTLTEDSEGRRFLVFDFPLFISFDKRAQLRGRLDAILGSDTVKAIAETGEFDPEALIGKNVLIGIVHNPSKDGTRTFANLDTIAPWPAKFGAAITPQDVKRARDGDKWLTPEPSAFRDIDASEAEMILYAAGKLPSGVVPAQIEREARAAAAANAPEPARPHNFQPAGVSNNLPGASAAAMAAQGAAEYDKLAAEAANDDPDVFDLPEGGPEQRAAMAEAHVA